MPTPAIATVRGDWRAAPLDRLLLWLAILQGSSATLSLALNLPTGQAAALAALVTALWGAMYLVAALGLFVAFGANWLTWLVRYRLPLTLLVAGAVFSAFWSVEPRLSVERGAHLVGTTLLALYLGLRLPLAEILRVSARALALLLVASALAAWLYPPLGLQDYQGRDVWRGVMASKNTLGFWAAVAALLFASRAATSSAAWRIVWGVLVVFALGCLAMSVSATSALALLVAALVTGYLYAASELRLGQVGVVVLGLIVVALVALAFRSIDTAELIGRSGDLTGRAQVWSETWRLIRERPFGGYGYGTIWFPTAQSLAIQQTLIDVSWTVYHAHNGLLQIASEVGLPLTVLMLLVVAQQLVEIVWCQFRRPQPGVLFVLGFTVALLVSNYAEARLLVNRDLFWIFFVTLPTSMLRQVALHAEHAPGPLGAAREPLPTERGARLAARLALKGRRYARRAAASRPAAAIAAANALAIAPPRTIAPTSDASAGPAVAPATAPGTRSRGDSPPTAEDVP